MSKTKMMAAKELIKEKRYDEARAILRTVSHPTATEWLDKIDKVAPERKFSQPKLQNAQRYNDLDNQLARKTKASTAEHETDKVLYRSSPSMFRAYPVLFIILVFSCLFLVGFPLLFLWWLGTKNTVLTITNEHVVLRKGILSKSINEIYLTDVRNVKISQGLFQRLMGTGVIEISTASSNMDDIVAKGLPNPYHIKEIINSARRR